MSRLSAGTRPFQRRARELIPLSPLPEQETARALGIQEKQQEAILLLQSMSEHWPDWMPARKLLDELQPQKK